MNFDLFALAISLLARLFIYVVIASSLLSFFLSPYHPLREALDRIVDPFLNPIRNMMPRGNSLDFSPVILILAVELLSRLLVSVFQSL